MDTDSHSKTSNPRTQDCTLPNDSADMIIGLLGAPRNVVGKPNNAPEQAEALL